MTQYVTRLSESPNLRLDDIPVRRSQIPGKLKEGP
jgi:hypothetical protein